MVTVPSLSRALLSAVTAVLVLAGLAVSGEQPAHADRTVTFGAYVKPDSGESEQRAVERVEAQLGRKLGAVRSFMKWEEPFPTSYHRWAVSGGRQLILSVKPVRANGNIITWSAIANATPGSTVDTEMRSWARRIRDLGGTVHIAFHHEPEASTRTAYGDANAFIQAWRKWVTVLREEGATNAKPMWIMTDYSFHVSPSDRRHAPKWYPGDAYVESMAIDAYNWYDCRPDAVNDWKTLESIVKPFRDFGAQHPTERLWLAEWASAEDAAAPSRKGTWISQAETMLLKPEYAQFDGISYFDHLHKTSAPKGCEWMIDSSAQTLAAFVALSQRPLFNGGQPDPDPDPDQFPTDEVRLTIMGRDSVSLHWRGSATDVRFGTSVDYDRSAVAVRSTPQPLSSSRPFHEVLLSGLTPGATYHYSIGGGPDRTFTAPVAPDAPFDFISFGDTAPVSKRPWTAQLHSQIAAADPSFLLHLGDLTDGNEYCQPTIDDFFNDTMAWSTRVPWQQTWGNHEYGPVNSESEPCAVPDEFSNYKGRFAIPNARSVDVNTAARSTAPGCPLVDGVNPCQGEDWGWFDVGSVRFITAPERFTNSVANWRRDAEAIMADAQNDPTISHIVTAIHRPSYTSHTPENYLDYRAATSQLRALFPKYVLTLNGHVHGNEVLAAPDGLIHITSGRGGSGKVDYETYLPESVFHSHHPMFVKGQVADGNLSISMVCGPDDGYGKDPCEQGEVVYGPIVFPTAGTPEVNLPPVSRVAAPACTELECQFDGSASTDSDGTIQSFDWSFSDGSTANGANPMKAFPAAGTYTATLTVTDDDAATHTTSVTVTVADAPGPQSIELVGSQAANSNTSRLSLAAPNATEPGDTMLLFVTGNRSDISMTTPTGWTRLGSTVDESMMTTVWWATSDGEDAVSVPVSATTKLDGQMVVYRGTANDPIVGHASTIETGSRATHTTPGVAGVMNGITVDYWADKTSTSTGWLDPGGLQVLRQSKGSGSGYISSLSAQSPSTTTATPRAATSTASGSKAIMWSVALRPVS